jgi:hypothetical protein
MAQRIDQARARLAERERLRRAREEKEAAKRAKAAKRAAAAKARAADRAARETARAERKAVRQAARQEKLEEATRRRVNKTRQPMVLPVANKPGVLKFFLPALNQPAAAGELPKNVKAVHLRLKGAGIAKIRRVPARVVNVRLGGERTLTLYGAR